MTPPDIGEVLEVDRESYPLPWPASAYRRELNNNQHARYIVLRERSGDEEEQAGPEPEEHRSWRSLLPWSRSEAAGAGRRGRIIGYAGMWLISDEAHITTIAIRHTYRGRGFGELLLATLIDIARDIGVRWMTLEVRMTNEAAQSLYRKYGFRNAGLRRRYYSDNNEDALIMTTDDITLNAYQAELEKRKAKLARRLESSALVVKGVASLSGRTV